MVLSSAMGFSLDNRFQVSGFRCQISKTSYRLNPDTLQLVVPRHSTLFPQLGFYCFQRRHFAQTPQVSVGLAKLGLKERLDEVPSDSWSHRPATHTKNVHMIVLDTLSRREMVVD